MLCDAEARKRGGKRGRTRQVRQRLEFSGWGLGARDGPKLRRWPPACEAKYCLGPEYRLSPMLEPAMPRLGDSFHDENVQAVPARAPLLSWSRCARQLSGNPVPHHQLHLEKWNDVSCSGAPPGSGGAPEQETSFHFSR